ncbi:MAG: VOC family protein [Actinomycetota bacterium]
MERGRPDRDPLVPDPRTMIGHVHLKVSDLGRAEAFYRDVLGFEVTTRYGSEAVFLSFGGYHHHVALNTWYSKGAGPAPTNRAGLFHFAILVPDRAALARALRRLLDHGVELDGAADHGVSEALYLHDPDGNGIEIYRDRDRSEWPTNPDGSVAMSTLPLDVPALLAEAG